MIDVVLNKLYYYYYYIIYNICKAHIREKTMTIVLTVGGAHLRVFLGNSIFNPGTPGYRNTYKKNIFGDLFVTIYI